MKLPFPSYQTTFTCDCTMQEAITRIQGCVLQNKKEMKIKKAEFNGVQTFVIETSTGSIFYNNSFLPLIKIRLKPIGEKTEIAILFEMKFSVKIISVWLVLLWIFMFTSMVVISIKDNLPLSYEIFLIPVILVALMSLVNITGLRITSKSKFKVFLEEFGFNPKDKENSPKLVWVKIFNCKNKSK